jgi:hypothetical protein
VVMDIKSGSAQGMYGGESAARPAGPPPPSAPPWGGCLHVALVQPGAPSAAQAAAPRPPPPPPPTPPLSEPARAWAAPGAGAGGWRSQPGPACVVGVAAWRSIAHHRTAMYMSVSSMIVSGPLECISSGLASPRQPCNTGVRGRRRPCVSARVCVDKQRVEQATGSLWSPRPVCIERCCAASAQTVVTWSV